MQVSENELRQAFAQAAAEASRMPMENAIKNIWDAATFITIAAQYAPIEVLEQALTRVRSDENKKMLQEWIEVRKTNPEWINKP